MPIAQSIEESIVSQATAWNGVTAEDRRGGRIEFVFGGEDLGHIDDDGSLDLPLSIPIREALVAAGRTGPHPVYGNTTGWTTYRVTIPAHVPKAVALLRVSYLYHAAALSKRNSSIPEPDLGAELETLGIPESVHEAFAPVA